MIYSEKRNEKAWAEITQEEFECKLSLYRPWEVDLTLYGFTFTSNWQDIQLKTEGAI